MKDNKTLRPIEIISGFQKTADGSALISFGNTRVLCAATIQPGVPPFLKGKNQGWLTAEYGMLPASTSSRKSRPLLKQDGRATEIQRLIGRSLRSAVDMAALGENTITVDCDVIEADGGTRTASITGGFVALTLACSTWVREGKLARTPVTSAVAAVSVGLVGNEPVLDLDYKHDSAAQTDMNVVALEGTGLIEVQGTGEKRAFTRAELDMLLNLAESGIAMLFDKQKEALGTDARFVRGWDAPLVIATQNPGKLRELRQMLGRHFSNVCSLGEMGVTVQADETADTFEGNAILKAEHAARLTGCAALADDSGIVADALGGAPGVHSARYAGEHASDQENLELLLDNLKHHTPPYKARFACCAALARPGKPTIAVHGTVEGEITLEPRGTDGFGYDPSFIAEGDDHTFAELSAEEKNQKSHRRRAIDALLRRMDEERGEA